MCANDTCHSFGATAASWPRGKSWFPPKTSWKCWVLDCFWQIPSHLHTLIQLYLCDMRHSRYGCGRLWVKELCSRSPWQWRHDIAPQFWGFTGLRHLICGKIGKTANNELYACISAQGSADSTVYYPNMFDSLAMATFISSFLAILRPRGSCIQASLLEKLLFVRVRPVRPTRAHGGKHPQNPAVKGIMMSAFWGTGLFDSHEVPFC